MKETNSSRFLIATIVLLAAVASCKKDPAPPTSCYRRDGSACHFVGLDAGNGDLPISDGSRGELGPALDSTNSGAGQDASTRPPNPDTMANDRNPPNGGSPDAAGWDAPLASGGAGAGTGGVAGNTGSTGSAGSTGLAGTAGTSSSSMADASVFDLIPGTDGKSDLRETSADVQADSLGQDARETGRDSSSDIELSLDQASEHADVFYSSEVSSHDGIIATDDAVDAPSGVLDAPWNSDTSPNTDGPPDSWVALPDVLTAETAQASDGATDLAAGVCPTIDRAQQFGVTSIASLALDGTGNPLIAAKLVGSADFGAGTLTSVGSADLVIAKLNPATLAATWNKQFSGTGEGANPSDQVPAGVAADQAGKMGVIGTFTGNLKINTSTTLTGGADPVDFIMITDASGVAQWGTKIDTQSGALASVASNPARNEFVVCGYTMGNMTALGISGSNNSDAQEDVVIAKFNDAGVVQWSRQIGGAGTQLCKTVALDTDGTVYAAGIHNGTVDFGDGALPVYDDSVGAVWIAKLDGANGNAVVSRSFGAAGMQAANRIAINGAGKVAVVGYVRGSIPFGAYTVTSAGGLDAYAVELDGNLVPLWATRWGDTADQSANGVSFDSAGDLLVVGYIKGSAILGSNTLTSAGLKDGFWAKLSGVDGSALCASIYGNATYDQSIDLVSVGSTASGDLKDKATMAGFGKGAFSVDGHTFSSATTQGFLLTLP